jgi:hypothetical protein
VGAGKVLAVDLDDVLVSVMPRWVASALAVLGKERGGLGPPLPTGAELEAAVLARSDYLLMPWLTATYGLPAELSEAFHDVYRNDATFYDGLPPTAFCRAILTLLQRQGAVEAVHVISHVIALGDPVNASKERWLGEWLRPSELPVTVHLVPLGTKKTDVMLQWCPAPDLFADDCRKNVIDVLSCSGVAPREILVPRMGHNEFIPDMETLARLRQIHLAHYAVAT